LPTARKDDEVALRLEDKHKALINAKNFAHIATINKDGTPQNSPVWVEMDGEDILINSEKGRVKVRNVKRNPHVSLSIMNMENPYQYMQVCGRVTEVTERGGQEGIDRLAKKYLGEDKYPWNGPDDVRVSIRIEPERISGQQI
jgi:PPOX class probable F420-dependent enzyme